MADDFLMEIRICLECSEPPIGYTALADGDRIEVERRDFAGWLGLLAALYELLTPGGGDEVIPTD